jgi:hypothetical protein
MVFISNYTELNPTIASQWYSQSERWFRQFKEYLYSTRDWVSVESCYSCLGIRGILLLMIVNQNMTKIFFYPLDILYIIQYYNINIIFQIIVMGGDEYVGV